MKRVQLISSVTLVSGLLFGLTMVNLPVTQDRSAPAGRSRLHVLESTKTPVRYTFQLLQIAAKSLNYFPTMQEAIAAPHPDELKTARVFQDAEVSLLGVGPIRIGMTLDEAANVLGLPLIPLGSNLSGECAYYQPDTKAQSLGLMAVDERIIRVDIWSGSTLPTVSGVTIGTAEEKVLELYPGQIETAPNPYTQGEFLTLTPNDPELSLYRLVFETDADGNVVQYRTGQFPAVTWPDGCV
ncbi:MAG: hypothetical protein F6K42_00945 [Leptolyngbya sp. SIO1D8]|nr:hypothetical protein [Leptolyngbya sp. SIO1D8]